MKKLMLLVFALFLALAVDAQEKKTIKGAIAYAKLDKAESTKVLAIQKEKVASIKAIKKQKLDKAIEKEKIKEVKQTSSKKIRAIVGKEKMKLMSAYWKKN
ncbi:hypothetical protein [Seonamhaeicola marinus]|uniref:Uncharacterized protein n=1 Tax=Seonamhaeicola marinus TaxID=1912246 RepID=A0A5D0IYU9_9FLAO|nr:hypothetical protein [Seonamhaeicola marinus]TYA86772.1 hypothetical protein FUA24_04400 [Seonamhaeicola marinus]